MSCSSSATSILAHLEWQNVNYHNRQDAERLRRAARDKIVESLGPLHIPSQETHLQTPSRQPPFVGKRVPSTFTADRTAKTRTLQNTTMTCDVAAFQLEVSVDQDLKVMVAEANNDDDVKQRLVPNVFTRA